MYIYTVYILYICHIYARTIVYNHKGAAEHHTAKRLGRMCVEFSFISIIGIIGKKIFLDFINQKQIIHFFVKYCLFNTKNVKI